MVLHVINFGSGKFVESQAIQNKYWAECNPDALIHPFDTHTVNQLITTKPTDRGHGYWQWKAMLLNIIASTLPDGDVLCYLDAGAYPTKNILDLVRDSINLFQVADPYLKPNQLRNVQWTKRDVLEYFKVLPKNPGDINNTQCWAGFQIYCLNSESRGFLSEMLEACLQINLIDDSPSTKPEFPFFKEHRHDQSIVSCMAIKHKIKLQKDPTQITSFGNEYIIHHRGNIGLS